MVKIRLKRQGNKHRPFYRIIVSTAEGGRDSVAIENLGTYNPISQPPTIVLKSDRAFHWLTVGAQPSETVAYLLKKEGTLEKYFESNPKARAKYKFLNKAISVMPKETVAVAAPEAPAKVETVAEAPAAEVPAAEAPATETPAE